MKIQKGVLISVDESDLIKGVFENKEITELSAGCFVGFKTLKKLILPKCTTVNNSIINCAALTTLSLPVCKEVVNYSIINCAALTTLSLPVCTTVNNSIRDCAALTTLSLPVCTTVNYSIRDCAALTTLSLPVCKEVVNYSIINCAALTTLSLNKHKLSGQTFDGYFFEITSEKSTKGIKIYVGYNFDECKGGKVIKKEGFVASKEGFNAHGETVKKAINDLQFKIVAEKLKKDPINKDTKLTVKYYRLLTGACDFGCRSWMEANKIPYEIVDGQTVEKKAIKASELLPILKKTNAYGLNKFESLLTF